MTEGTGRILVTGGTGFVGGHVVERLRGGGERVRALARPGADPRRLEAAGAEIAIGDLGDPDSLARAVEACDRVIHLAALVSSRLPSVRDLEAVNVEGTRNLAAAAAAAGVRRFVHVSTCGVYGSRNRVPTDEEAPLRPDTPYRISKARGERAAEQVMQRTGLPVVIARIPAVLGAGGRNWVPIVRSVRDGSFRRIGNGRNRIHFGDVADIVDGLALCASTPEIGGRRYNLAARSPITLGNMIATIADELGVARARRPWPGSPFRVTRLVDLWLARHLGLRVRRLHSYDLFLADRCFDISRARRELGFDPRVPVVESLRALVRHYLRDGSLDGPGASIDSPADRR